MTVPVDSRTRALWLFDERYDTVAPSDAAGNLGDLEVGSGLTRPAVVDTSNGKARAFTASPTTGYEVADTNDDLLLARDVSIVAVVAFDITAQNTAGTPGTIVWRGRNTDESSFGLRLTVEDFANSRARLQLIWELDGGTEVVDSGCLITWPADDEMLIAAIREVEGDGFAVRYVVNGQATNGQSGHDLGLGGTTGADVFIGCEPSGASAFTNHLAGSIAYLEIVGEALSVDEVEQVWLGYLVDATRGVVGVRGLLPPGAYSKDPSSYIQREVSIEGAMLGNARNRARRRRSFPGAADGEHLERWERLTGRRVRSSDSLPQRQQRVVDWLKLDPGLDTDSQLAELLEAMGYTDTADISQLLYSATYTEDFSTWTSPGEYRSVSIDGNGTWLISASRLEIDATGPIDSRYTHIGDRAPMHLFSATASRDLFFGSRIDRLGVPSTGDVLIGYTMGSRSAQRGDWLWIGLVFDGVDYKVNSYRYSDGVGDTAFTELSGTAINGATVYFRFRHLGDGVYNAQWGTSDALAQAQTPTQITGGPADPLWVGPAVVAIDSSSAANYEYDDWYMHEVNGEQPLTYHLFRDPADPGEYDIAVAQDLLREISHAHYEGFVTDETQLLCDNTGGCDREPMGA